MIKECIYISIFAMLFINYIILFKKLIAERKYFINTLSHDFRIIALSQIKALGLLQKKCNTDSFNTELINGLNESSKFSLELINSLINTYKYKNNEQVLNYETFNLNEIFSNIYNKYLDLVTNKKLDFYYDFQDYTRVNADKKELHKAIEIILITAISNANNNSKIIIKSKTHNASINFSISYNGHQLTEEEIKRMFYDNTNFSSVGHGVKLHLCKNIIDFHNGKINVHTTQTNITSFSVTIPNRNDKDSNLSILQPCIQ